MWALPKKIDLNSVDADAGTSELQLKYIASHLAVCTLRKFPT